MTKSEIIIAGLALAFALVNVLFPLFHKSKVTKRKPFNCVMCISGWASFGLSLFNGYVYGSVLFLVVGLFAGAMFEAISMRWL